MAIGSQNLTTYLAKGLKTFITNNAINSDNLLYINTSDTNITADILGTSNSIAFTRMSTTGAHTTGHIVWLNAADIGTPFQLVVHDSSELYFYKRWKSSGVWSDWKKMSAGHADDATKITSTPNNTTTFLRGDNTWSNTLGGAFQANGTITANGGYLKSTANSNTVTIGSQNTGCCHIYNSANIPFAFNNTVFTTTGNLGSTSYPWNNLYIGKANGAGIYYQGSKANYRMIRFIDNASDTYGNGISIGGGGQTIIGGGESADTAAAQVGTAGSEVMYICNDGNVDIMSNLQNGWDNRKVMTLNTSGYLMLPSYINVPTSNNENPSVSQFIVTNGSDHYYRKASVAHAASALDGQHKWVRLAGDTMSGALYTTDLRAANTRLVSNWLGFYASTNAGGNRYGYISADANRMYFRKENGVSSYHFDFNGHVYTSQAFYTASGIYLTSNTNARLTLDRCTVYAANGVVGIHSSTNRGVYEFTDSKWIIFLQHSDDTVRSSYKIYGAVWNDYAEYRNAVNAKPGQCIIESPTHKMELSTKRLQPGGKIVSDTFGFAIGQTEIDTIPIAVSGRVLAYPYKPINDDDLGKAVCTAPNGTVDIMTREEIREYPDRIIGTISEIPNYDIWYGGSNATAETKADNIPIVVDGRIWIYVR